MDAVCVLAGGKKVTFTARVRQSEGDVLPGDPMNQADGIRAVDEHDLTHAFLPLASVVPNSPGPRGGRRRLFLRYPCQHHFLDAGIGLAGGDLEPLERDSFRG